MWAFFIKDVCTKREQTNLKDIYERLKMGQKVPMQMEKRIWSVSGIKHI